METYLVQLVVYGGLSVTLYVGQDKDVALEIHGQHNPHDCFCQVWKDGQHVETIGYEKSSEPSRLALVGTELHFLCEVKDEGRSVGSR